MIYENIKLYYESNTTIKKLYNNVSCYYLKITRLKFKVIKIEIKETHGEGG